MNTIQSGIYRWMIFKEGDAWIGVALEFNIVVTGEDPRLVEIELQQAVNGYLESAKKLKGFRTEQINTLLNQDTDDEYEARWNNATQIKAQKASGVPSFMSSDVYKAGTASLALV